MGVCVCVGVTYIGVWVCACVWVLHGVCVGVTVCAKKTLPCTVRFTPDRLSKTEVKRLSNGLGTDIERTENGR